MFINFHSVNTPTTAKLPTWCCWTRSWEVMLTTGSQELAWANLSTSLILNTSVLRFQCLKSVDPFLHSIASSHFPRGAVLPFLYVWSFGLWTIQSLELHCRWPLSSNTKVSSIDEQLTSRLLIPGNPTSNSWHLSICLRFWGFFDYLGSMNSGHKHEWGLPEDDKFSGETFSSPLPSPKIDTVSFVSCLFFLGRLISHLSSQREYSSLGPSSTRDLLLNLLLEWALDYVLPLHTL